MGLIAGRQRGWRLALLLTIAAADAGCGSSQSRWNQNDGGTTRWVDVAGGRLKTRVYTGASLSKSPVLVLVLHGDLPEPPPSYQYEFAKIVAAGTADVIAAGVLRPGYSDPAGERSSGDMGRAMADNYTPEVVDAVAGAARELSDAYHAETIVLVAPFRRRGSRC